MATRSSFRDKIDDDAGEKQCRACLVQHSSDHLYSLDSKNLTVMDDGSEQTIAEIYHQCTQLAYEPADGHFKWICQYCIEKMIDFCQFRKMCIDSYSTLKATQELNDDSLKAEILDEYDDSTAFRVELTDAVAVKQETSLNLSFCNTSQLDEQIVETQIEEINFNCENLDEKNKCVGLNVPSQETDTKKQVHGEEKEEKQTNDGNDTDFAGFDDFDDDSDDDSDSMDGGAADLDNNDESDDSMTLDEELSLRKKLSALLVTTAAVKPKRDDDVETPEPKNEDNSDLPKSKDPIYACDKCPLKFFREYRYNAHVRRIHMGLKAYKCEHCDAEFQKLGTLKSHTAAKHYDESEGKPEFICDYEGCGKSYTRKETLRSHIKFIHHKRKANCTEKMCELCGKKFKNNAALVKHTYTHTKVTPFKCQTCSRMFATNHKLKEHTLRHNGIKNFVCPTCGLRKTTGHELRVHMQLHDDIRYPCDLCTSDFSKKEYLTRHIRVVHCGVKAYKCPYCDQSFGKTETRKYHVMTHTGERPHACKVCDKRFIQPIALKTHMKTHNKNK